MSDNVLTIELKGSIDTYNSQDYEREVLREIESSESENIIIDISGVNYMSSTGVGALVGINSRITKQGRKLFILGMTTKIHEVFSLLGFISFFNLIDNSEDIYKETSEIFPIEVKCPSCGKKLKIIKSGKFKCSSCKGMIRINKKGEVEE